MAHKSNVVQVQENLNSTSDSSEEVIDPVCQMKITRKTARHVLFRPDATYYFCSKACQMKFKGAPSAEFPKQKRQSAA